MTIILPGGLPQAPTSNTITWGLGFCQMNLGGEKAPREPRLTDALSHRIPHALEQQLSNVLPTEHLLHCTLEYINPSTAMTLNYMQCTSIFHINYLSTLKNGGCNPLYFTSALTNNNQLLEREIFLKKLKI